MNSLERLEYQQQNILRAIIEDNDEELASILLENQITQFRFSVIAHLNKMPELFSRSPSLQSVVCYFGSVKCFDLLSNLGFTFVDKSDCDDHGRNAIHFASAGNHISIIRKLAHIEEIFYSKDDNGLQPIFYACQYGSLNTVQYMFSKHVSLIDAGNQNVDTLDSAAGSGFLDVVKFLIENIPQIPTEKLVLAIKRAASNMQTDIVYYMLDRYKNTDCVKEFVTPILSIDNVDLFKRALKVTNEPLSKNHLISIVSNGCSNIMRYIMSNGMAKDLDPEQIIVFSNQENIIQEFWPEDPFKYAITCISPFHTCNISLILTIISSVKLTPEQNGQLFIGLCESPAMNMKAAVLQKLYSAGCMFESDPVEAALRYGSEINVLDDLGLFDSEKYDVVHLFELAKDNIESLKFLIEKKQLLRKEIFKSVNIIDSVFFESTTNNSLGRAILKAHPDPKGLLMRYYETHQASRNFQKFEKMVYSVVPSLKHDPDIVRLKYSTRSVSFTPH